MKSSRAAVFTEFCFIAPLLVMLVSAMIELAGYFDAQVMANHTAWTIGRQATVHMDELTVYSKDGKAIERYRPHFTANHRNRWEGKPLLSYLGAKLASIKDLTDHGRTTAVLMMSTCGMGYFGFNVGELPQTSLENVVKVSFKSLQNVVKSGLDGLKKKKVSVSKVFELDKTIPSGLDSFITPIVDRMVQKLMGALIDKAVQPASEFLVGKIGDLFTFFAGRIDKALAGNTAPKRRCRQLMGALMRAMNERHKDSIYSISYPGCPGKIAKGKEKEYIAAGTNMGIYRIDEKNAPLNYPAAFCQSSTRVDGYNVTGYYGWPPNGQIVPMMRVDVKWPYEAGWIFPVISGFRDRGKTIVAEGSSLVFPQPAIENENLKSDNPAGYPKLNLEDPLMDAINRIANRAKRYLELMTFALEYRIRTETLTTRTHKNGGRVDKYITPFLYFWFADDSHPKESLEANEGSGHPWGSPGSTDPGTVRDQKLGYWKTVKILVGTENTWDVDESQFKMATDGTNRDREPYFYWKNDKLRNRYPRFALESGYCGYFYYIKCKEEYDKLRRGLMTYAQELRKQINGNASGTGADGDAAPVNAMGIFSAEELSKFDLGDKEGKEKAIRYFENKWTQMEKQLNGLYEEIDQKVGELDGMVKNLENQCREWARLENEIRKCEGRMNMPSQRVYREILQTRIADSKKRRNSCDRQGNKLSPEVQRIIIETLSKQEAKFCAQLGSPSAAKVFKGEKSLEQILAENSTQRQSDNPAVRDPFAPGKDNDGGGIKYDKWRLDTKGGGGWRPY